MFRITTALDIINRCLSVTIWYIWTARKQKTSKSWEKKGFATKKWVGLRSTRSGK